MQGGRMRSRALFWPGVLILVGAFALLINLNLVPTDRLYLLGDLWPVLLIVLGLVLLVRRSPLPARAATAAVAVILVAALVGAGLYVALAPAIPGGTHQLTAREPAGKITEATLEIDAGASKLHVQGSSSMAEDLVQTQI